MAAEKSKKIVEHTANLDFIIRYVDFPGCTSLKWGALAAELYHKDKIDAILGPGCSFSVAEVARLAAEWNIPHITYGGNGEFLANKTEFATLTRLSSNLNSFGKFYLEVLRVFNWSDVVSIYDTAQYSSANTGRDLQNVLESDSHIKAHVRTFRADAPNLRNELIRVLKEAKKVARVFLVTCHGNFLRQLVLLAPFVGLKPGEYTIIFIMPDRSFIGDYGWERGDEFDLAGTPSHAVSAAVSTRIGIYKGAKVHIRKLKIKAITIDRRLLLELKTMREINCPNLITLIGLCSDVNRICILTEFCSRGTMQVILHNISIQLDKDFRLSLINDIVQGMYYLHKSPIEVHGHLTSASCIIDSRFVLKITGFGLKCIDDHIGDVTFTQDYSPVSNSDILWTAPEILRTNSPWKPTQPGDVYSFAIILYEMCTRSEPYTNERWFKSVKDTTEQIRACRANPRRPSFGNNSSYPEIFKLAIECWKEKPEERPTFRDIRRKLNKYLRRDNPHGDNVLDMLLNRMEQYANNLEGLVMERTNAFLEEKKRSEELLYEVLPKSVADQLKVGQMVTPEAFDNVTIYFSDIVGFTTISAASTPLQIVDFLNDVYTCFDETIGHFDVYKVETIGDAYMVVSGLPIRNENEHARQIARMSLKILDQVQQFIIRHQPETPLRARIGINSGPVVSGVVGRKMPRYCLFGDTVNTASRMESNGLPLRIHISDSTRDLLEIFGNFLIEERGNIEIKGKGMMFTHWLVEEQSIDIQQAL